MFILFKNCHGHGYLFAAIETLRQGTSKIRDKEAEKPSLGVQDTRKSNTNSITIPNWAQVRTAAWPWAWAPSPQVILGFKLIKG